MISWFRRQEGAALGSQGRRADPGKGAWYDLATAAQAQSNPGILCQFWGAKPLHLGATGTASVCPWGRSASLGVTVEEELCAGAQSRQGVLP